VKDLDTAVSVNQNLSAVEEISQYVSQQMTVEVSVLILAEPVCASMLRGTATLAIVTKGLLHLKERRLSVFI
jgi:hypothetical protein